MHPRRSITLIAPRIAPAMARAVHEAAGRWPALARLAGRGSARCIEPSGISGASALAPWQIALLETLGLGDSIAQYPDAAVRRAADGNERTTHFWLRATPLHFVAGLDHLSAMSLTGDAAASPAEREQLAGALAPHLLAAGFELTATSRGDWLLRSEMEIEVTTAAPEIAVANPLDEMMPQGRDARMLRRLMTELQMLLHEHPVNIERARRGAPEINAIWVHGAGALGDIARRALPDGFGDDPYLIGLYRLHGQAPVAPAADAATVLGRMQSSAVAVIDAHELDEIESRWLPPLLRAVRGGAVAKFELVLDRWRLTFDRGAMLRFWRGARAPSQWAAC